MRSFGLGAGASAGQKITALALTVVCAVLVLYPIYYLIQAALNVGDPQARPPEQYGLANFVGVLQYTKILTNTVIVALVATVFALLFGFVMGWILSRTNVPGRATFEQLMALPYYVTPLMGALAWSLLGSPESGFVNQVWRTLGGEGYLININTAYGIAWVMAIFEGSVAFVMIGAVMKSMDPSLEEASQVLGGGRVRTMLRVTLPLVAPGVLGAAVFVFAEMLGSFSAALVLGLPNRFYVITTAMYQLVSQYPPKFPLAAAMGVSLFAVMFVIVYLYRRIVMAGTYETITGKAFRPRVMRVGGLRWSLLAVCLVYLFLAVALPVFTLAYASFQKLATAFPRAGNWTLANYTAAWSMEAVRSALANSLLLGLATATLGVGIMGLLAWIIYRSRLPGRAAIEYLVMFPQAVPRLVFAFGMMWAWLVFPIPIYGTLWLLLIAYLTVFLPLGVRTIAGVLLQIDKNLEECAQMCGAPWGYRLRTVTLPLLRPGVLAAWLLLFIASVRELGASILLMGPKAKVITPAIVESWFATSSELTAAMALLQTLVVGIAVAILLVSTRRLAQLGGE
ncbi:MAG TPA: iron ABC transporter permease [Candidatus Baltobacteraceae bacterium]|nr:iron ABC transporter permease [Candidatus Baltobacteraceae bacterium]